MKILKKLLLINWHYFTHQLLEFEQLNYMTGVNASGKSTIIDALQLILLGDTAGKYFNKSASGKSARTLESYLCGEISDNAEGGYRYLREGRFTSYAVTEWYDDEKRRSLTFGGVFDVHSPGDRTGRFFRYIGQIPGNHFIESRVPMEIPKLREYFKQNNVKDPRFFDSGTSYREDIYGLLGGLRPKFKDLLKKAVAFNPDNNIQKFITEFVCESEKGIDVAELRQMISRAQEEYNKLRAQFEQIRSRFQFAKNALASRSSKISADELDATAAIYLESTTEVLTTLSSLFEKTENMTPEQVTGVAQDELTEIVGQLENLKETATLLSAKLQENLNEADEKLRALNAEKESLEKGRFQFPQNAIDLKQAILSQIKSKTGQTADVVLVAEAAEIRNDRWRNAIEGYLNTQKFYIIVPPQFVRLAIRVFDRIKRDKAVYDTGVVDVEKILNKKPRAEQNSLAKEIETDNPYVRAYLDYLLGRVMKCDSAEHIRDNRISITDEGLLYKNYVVRALNPKLWSHPAIGQNAIILRLNGIQIEMNAEKKRIEICATLKAGADACKIPETYSKNDLERFVSAAEQTLGCAKYREEITALEQEQATIDTGNLILLRESVEQKKQAADEAEHECGRLREQSGVIRGGLESLRNDRIPRAEREAAEKQRQLRESFAPEWIENSGEPRYLAELSKREQARQIAEAFPREKSRAANAAEKYRNSLVSQRTDYNNRFKMGYNVYAEDDREYAEALRVINENTLPDYLTRIEDTKKKAMEEFQEDFLSKLSEKIRSVKHEIKELNYAISSASFGEDTYRFTVEPNKDYERYYKMITDEMLMGGYTLMTNQYNEKYREEISELFSVMTGEGNSVLDQSEYEKRVSLFTDYRTYLTFDIEVTNKDGEKQRLSRTIDKKSGGETQTPFYIAVLASFAQLYRMGRDKKANTARLIIFDEAFSKMDGERIEKSILLLRKIGFQVILSTPTEKAGDIAPWVDRILLVLRSGKNSQVTVFDKERVGELIDE